MCVPIALLVAELAATPLKGYFVMQKAHLIEALYLVNQGTDEAVRGLQRLKKAAGFKEETYGDTLATLEHARAKVNLQFFSDMQASEQKDATHFERVENKNSTKDSIP
jgi:hypothetical protein